MKPSSAFDHKRCVERIIEICFISLFWFGIYARYYHNKNLGYLSFYPQQYQANDIQNATNSNICKLPSDLCDRIEHDIEYYTKYSNISNFSLTDLQACSEYKRSRNLLTYIINGTVYHPKQLSKRFDTEKGKYFLLLLKSVVTFYPNMPNSAFILNYPSTGHGCFLKTKNLSVPTFCISRSDTDDLEIDNEYEIDKHCILFPNPYFKSLFEWKNKSETFFNTSQNIKNKIKKLYWFGGVYGKAGYKRVEFLILANKTDLIDSYWTGFDECKKCARWKNYSTLWNPNTTDSEINATIRSLPKGKWVGKSNFTGFAKLFGKYAANIALPGTTKGSYSRHLQFMLALDSVPFLWDNVWYEWYYNGLIHNYNIIKVNKTNLYNETSRVLSMSDKQIDQIKRNKELFFETHLSANSVAAYIYNLLVKYQTIQPEIDWDEVKNDCVVVQ